MRWKGFLFEFCLHLRNEKVDLHEMVQAGTQAKTVTFNSKWSQAWASNKAPLQKWKLQLLLELIALSL